jgi:hypothetical protein
MAAKEMFDWIARTVASLRDSMSSFTIPTSVLVAELLVNGSERSFCWAVSNDKPSRPKSRQEFAGMLIVSESRSELLARRFIAGVTSLCVFKCRSHSKCLIESDLYDDGSK